MFIKPSKALYMVFFNQAEIEAKKIGEFANAHLPSSSSTSSTLMRVMSSGSAAAEPLGSVSSIILTSTRGLKQEQTLQIRRILKLIFSFSVFQTFGDQ